MQTGKMCLRKTLMACRANWNICLWLLFMNNGISQSQDLGDANVQAQLSALRSDLRAVLERVRYVDHRFSALDHRITALEHRMNSLDQQRLMSGLGHSASPLASSSASVGQWRQEPSDAGDGSIAHAELIPEAQHFKSSSSKANSFPFRLTAVRSVDTGHVYIVSLHYRTPTVPDVLLTLGPYPVPVKTADSEVATVYIPKGGESSPQPWLYFVFPDYFVSVRLNLSSSPQMDLPPTTLKIAQGNDVTFPSGHKAQINFVFYVKGDAKAIESESAVLQFLTKSEKEKPAVDRLRFFSSSGHFSSSGNVQLDLIDMQGSKRNWRGVLLINSSNADVEGVLEAFITLNFNCSVNCLVRQMTQQHHVKVHRAAHQEPFPEGFIGFVRDVYKRNATHVQCDLGPYAKPCAVLCEAVGNQVTSVHIQKVGSPAVGSARTRLLTAGKGGYWGVAMMTFDPLQVEDGGEYLCSARSGEKEISQRMALVVHGRLED